MSRSTVVQCTPHRHSDLKFVIADQPDLLKADSSVRSHISKRGWKAYTKPGRPKGRRGRDKEQKVVFECVSQDADHPCWQLPLVERQFGGGRVDPFRTYPGPWNPQVPGLVDHYLVHMAVDIPELDQPGNKGLLRTSWFPLVLSDEAPFQTVMLLSAANKSSVSGTSIPPNYILQLRLQAISSINALMATRDDTSDALIGAVAKMASFEAMHGGIESYRIHMRGLYDMVEKRSGLDSLGLNGLLRRIIIWIDINSSFLLQIPRWYPDEYFTDGGDLVEPNPERFIAP
ncbi:fungal specific transcription factor factor domain protein [Fusarium subglutinans]|uniref:Fungal specific transcription factor factor domain protein n=1 Tax=Gibberella subglutinans TaxID=42677 RepID=A0A8H5PIR7_GIBSU|nr:fungal specific transcription factor factor domain protein [Fusarium subglutinans]KAF5597600.1 fungal specific transcription factor factor domain protein [Fusarium subglutinans]